MFKLPDRYREIENCRVPLRNRLYLKDNEVDLKMTE